MAPARHAPRGKVGGDRVEVLEDNGAGQQEEGSDQWVRDPELHRAIVWV